MMRAASLYKFEDDPGAGAAGAPSGGAGPAKGKGKRGRLKGKADVREELAARITVLELGGTLFRSCLVNSVTGIYQSMAGPRGPRSAS